MAQYASIWKADAPKYITRSVVPFSQKEINAVLRLEAIAGCAALIKLPGNGAIQKDAKTGSMEPTCLKTKNLENLALLFANEKNLLPATRVVGTIYDDGISRCTA